MHESCQPNCLVGGANGGHTRWHPALRSPVSLHVPALCTEHAWGRSVLRTRAEIMESPLVSALQRCVKRSGRHLMRTGRPEIVLQDTQRAFERKDYD